MAYLTAPDDPYTTMRQKQRLGIFEPPQTTLPTMPTSPGRPPFDMTRPEAPPMSESSKYFEAMNKARENRPMTDQYRAALAQAPKDEDYTPSNWRRIGAGLAGAAASLQGNPIAGVAMTEQFLRAPYNEALSKYKTNLESARTAAEIEQGDIEQHLGIMKDAASLGLDYDKYRSVVANQNVQNQLERRRIEIEEDKADTARMLAERPDYDAQDVVGGVLYINKYNPRDQFTVKGETIASMNARINESNANTNAANARTAEYNAKTGRANQESLAAYRNARLNQLGQELSLKFNQQKPLDVQRAYEQALRELEVDPAFGDMINRGNYDKGEDPYVLKEGISPAQYDILKEAIERKMNLTLKGVRPMGSSLGTVRSRDFTSSYSSPEEGEQ